MEKMLMTQALDERDLLVKKISSKIQKLSVCDTKKVNEEKTYNAKLTPAEFEAKVRSGYQQIQDYIARYQRLDAAIIRANTETVIVTPSGRMTLASAIAIRNRVKGWGIYGQNAQFEKILQEHLQDQFNLAKGQETEANNRLDREAEMLRSSIVGKDSKAKEDRPLDVVDAYVKENRTEIIDPLGAEKLIQKISDDAKILLSYLDTAIKVSNTTTTIEF